MARPEDVERLRPFLESLSRSRPGGGIVGGNLQSQIAAINAQRGPQEETDWDKFWRPATHLINALTSGGYGVVGAADKFVERDLSRPDPVTPLDYIGRSLDYMVNAPGDFLGSMGDALANNQENLRHGNELIENATDLAGRRSNPDYVDEQDNVNPWVKGIGGFAIDVAADPLTWLPGGAIISGIKGAGKGATLASRALGEGATDVQRTGALIGGFLNPANAGRGINEWSAARAAQKADSAAIRQAKKDIKAGRTPAGGEDLYVPRSGANRGAEIGTKRVEADGIDDANALRTQKELDDTLSSLNTRLAGEAVAEVGAKVTAKAQKAIQEGVSAPVAPAVPAMPAPLPPTLAAPARAADGPVARQAEVFSALSETAPRAASVADIRSAVKRLTYTTPAYGAEKRAALLRLRPAPVVETNLAIGQRGARMKAKDSKSLIAKRETWNKRVAAIGGEELVKKLRPIRDPEEFARILREEADRVTPGKVKADAKASEILRQLTTQKRVFDEDQLKPLLRALGLEGQYTPTAGSMQEFFRSKNVRQILTKALHEEKRRTTLAAQARLSFADEIEAAAKTMTGDTARAEGARQLSAAVRAVDDETQAAYDAVFRAAGGGAYGSPKVKFQGKGQGSKTNIDRAGDLTMRDSKEFGAGVAVVKQNVWNQQKSYSFITKAFAAASDLAAAKGLKNADRADFVYNFVKNGVKYLDGRLRAIGVTPVTGKTTTEAQMFKGSGGAEWAFLGFSDILDALPDFVGRALLAEGKNLSVAPTILSDIARLTLRMSSDASISVGDRVAQVYTMVQKLYSKMPANAATRRYVETPRGQQALEAAVKAMSLPEVRQALVAANIRNGAMARAVVGEVSHRISQPIADVLMKSLKETTSTAGGDVDAILKAYDDLRAIVTREGLNKTDAQIAAQYDLELVIANNIDIGTAKNVRAAVRMDSATKIDPQGAPLPKEKVAEKVAAGTDAGGGVASATGTLTKPKKAPKKSEAGKKAEAAAKAGANTARADEVSALSPEIEDITNRMRTEIAAEETASVTLEVMRANLTMGLPNWLKTAYRASWAMSGRAGMKDLKTNEIAAAISTRKAATLYETDLAGIAKRYDADTIVGAWNVIRTMGKNSLDDAMLAGAPEKIAAAVKEIWPLSSKVFDHSQHSLLARMGLPAEYLNNYLRRVGLRDEYLLPDGKNSWEIADLWKKWEMAEGVDPLTLLNNYHKALQQASVAPGIAASFSSEFGHRSAIFGKPMTDAEAVAAGWKKVDASKGSAGGLSQFIDPEQYFPEEMIGQLALLDNYLSKSRILDQDKIFDKVFRQVDPIVNAIKASITLWRPGHHVTNIMGETIFNTLAGVTNPARYSDGFNVLRAAGMVDGETSEAVTKYLREAAPDGYTVRGADSGQGVLMTIGGKPQYITYDSAFRLFDDMGIVIHHQVAEDLVTESAEAMGRNAKFQWLQDIATPRWLGQTAAARDNLFRLTHAVDILSKRSFRSVEDMKRFVAQEVHSYHPTMQTLSAFEQKYVRRFMYFYTWQRQAISRVFESLIDTPGRIMVAPKAIFNMSVANGVDAQSFGEPMPNDPRIPAYSQGNITSVLAKGPLQGVDPDGNFLWSASLNAPQLDILQLVFGDIRINPDEGLAGVGEGLFNAGRETLFGAITPAIRVPAELMTNSRVGENGEIRNIPEYLLDQTGLRVPSVLGAFGERSDVKDNPAEEQARRETAILNWLAGLRAQNVTSPAATNRAAADRAAELRRIFESTR